MSERNSSFAAPDPAATDLDDEALSPSRVPVAQGAPSDADFDEEFDEEDEEGQPAPSPQWEVDDNPHYRRATQLETENQQLRTQQQQLAYQQAEAAWDNAEVQMQQQASGMDAYEKADYIAGFYKNRERALRQTLQQVQMQQSEQQQFLSVQQQAKNLIAQLGLDAEDEEPLIALGAFDPSRMAAEAKRRSEVKQRYTKLDQRLARLEQGDRRDRRVRSGAERIGGGGRARPRGQEVEAGSDDQLLAIFEDQGVPFVPGR